ncbi:MAG: hypothetical protein ABIQ55_00355 [Gemmatimonadaceae bacterium]
MQTDEMNERAAYRMTLLRLNARAWGIAVGLISGIGLFAATIFLLMKGGPDVGAHLALLGSLLPGYRVSVGGAFIGFGYLFVIGYAIGRVIGSVYNRLARGN